MLINIPEQKNCWHCGFLDYEQGFCILKNMIECGNMYGPYNTKGYGEDPHLEENRPDWCPFKQESDVVKTLCETIDSLNEENSKLAEVIAEISKYGM